MEILIVIGLGLLAPTLVAAIIRWWQSIQAALFKRRWRPNRTQRTILKTAQQYSSRSFSPGRSTSTQSYTASQRSAPQSGPQTGIEKEYERTRLEVTRLSSEVAVLKSEKVAKETAVQFTITELLREKADLERRLAAQSVSSSEPIPNFDTEKHDEALRHLKKQEAEIQRSITELRSRRDVVARELAAELSAEIGAEKEKALKEHQESLRQLKNREAGVQTEIGELLEKKKEIGSAVQNLEMEYTQKRNELGNILAQSKNIDLHAEKEKTLNELFRWMEREQVRLQTRFDEEYQSKVSAVKSDLESKIKEEFQLIDQFFSNLAGEEKKVVEKDVKKFLEQRLAELVQSDKNAESG